MMASERGEVSLTAVLVACVLLVSVLGSTLGLFEGFIGRAADQTARTDAEDAARTASDAIARNLRNLADPTTVSPQVVERIGTRDLIFKMVDANGPNAGQNVTNTQRVRYCLDASRQLLQQTQTWTDAATPAMPATSACPGTGWPVTRVLASSIVNDATVPVFTYDTTTLSAVAGVHVDLVVDTDTKRNPPATRLGTGVFLRNQNRPPEARFEAAKAVGGVLLNGSASVDPEGAVLDYAWSASNGAAFVPIGEGITLNYAMPAGTTRTIRLTVSDPSGLTHQIEKSVTA